MQKNLLIAIILLLIIPVAWSQEFLLHDKTYTWHADDDVCGGYSYWYDHGNAPTMNWTSPFDYQNGEFYYYFEIIDQPSSAPFKLNFCIWADRTPDGNSWQESCGYRSGVLAGSGSYAQFSSPVLPALNGGIDWSDLSKLWRYGIPLWVNGHNMGNGPYCTDNPEEWANQALYFPLKLRVVVVVVASGYAFSGWDNYLGGGCTPYQQATPNYGLDYINETTNNVVPSTDEYSYSSDMSGAVSGGGAKLSLTPGTDVYFRTKKISDCILASTIQHLVVKARSSTPSFSVDFVNEKTNEIVSSAYQYSAQSNMSDAVTGTGSKLTITPGSNLYFRNEATTSAFRSLVQTLTVPARPATPAFTIDYQNEATATVVPTDCEYANNAGITSAVSGTGSTIPLTPESTVYFMKKATSSQFISAVQTMIVPARPATPSYTVNYSNEHTVEMIPTTVEYSALADMTGPVVGSGGTIGLLPGSDLYFRVKYTPSSFVSSVFHLPVDQRPALTTTATDTVHAGFTASVDFHKSVTGFAANDIEATNATVTLTGGLNIRIDPVTQGNVSIMVIANAVNQGNFASDTIETYYKVLTSTDTGIKGSVGSLLVYPSPFSNFLFLEITRDFKLPVDLRVLNGSGAIVIHRILVSNKSVLEMQDVPAGLYIIKAIDARGNEISCKIIKQ